MSRTLPILVLGALLFVGLGAFFSQRLLSHPVITPQILPVFAPTGPVSLPPQIQIGLVGDLGLGRYITSTARQKNDFGWSFQGVTTWLKENDINVANLESPIVPRCPVGKTGTFTFCGDEKFLPYLKENKLTLSLQNNHILNYGLSGLESTKNFLASTSIPFYYDTTLVGNYSGVRLAYLGFDFVSYPNLDKTEILRRVSTAKTDADYVIVSLHWGNEYLSSPERWRVDFAHQLVDAGADIIHGHHPHVWQGAEVYKDKLIFYSFGNFIFDQSWSYETSHSQIARVTLQKGEPLVFQLFPLEIRFNSQPWLAP